MDASSSTISNPTVGDQARSTNSGIWNRRKTKGAGKGRTREILDDGVRGWLLPGVPELQSETLSSSSIPAGEGIAPSVLQAIQSSDVYTAIFFRNYASSPWCLHEVAYMVDLRSKLDGEKLILPIFHSVEHSDVGLQTRLHDEGLLKLAERFGSEVTGQWRKALIEAASTKGWLWDGNPKSSLGRQVNSVVEDILKRLKKLPVGHEIRIDDQVQALIDVLNVDGDGGGGSGGGGDGVHFVGIYGVGGIGKTVLAKVVFNRLHSRFEGSSFLEDVRESSLCGCLLTCLKQLLLDIIQEEPTSVYCVDEGRMFIKERLSNKKVLILDDINCREQLKALARHMNWFGLGSKIIIPIRDKHVLNLHIPLQLMR